MASADLKSIPIAELEAGMFVVKVVSKSVELKVKTEGIVRTQTSIQNLKNAGVETVWIDPDRSEIPSQERIDPALDSSPSAATPNPSSFEEHMQQAMKLYEQAKNSQKRMLEKVKLGQGIDVKELETLSEQIIDSVFANPNALLFMTKLKNKDEYLYQHSLDVAILMSVFAKYLDFSAEVTQRLAMGALMHDTGMLNLPENYVNNPETFTPEQYQQVQPHVGFSLDMAASIPGITEESLDVIRLHHERLDGSGYPNALQGDAINIHGRMAALVDSYCAMTSDRAHKTAVSAATAFKIMRNGTPNAYDNDLMGQLIRCIGVFPVGTLVKLKSQRLALVTESNYHAPLQPKVGVFYSVRTGTHLEVKHLNLASKQVDDEILSSVRPDEFNLDLVKFLKNSLF